VTVIVSGGQRARVGAKSFPFPSGSTSTSGPSGGWVPLLRGDGTLGGTYEAMVRSQPILYAVVAKLTFAASRLPFNAYQEIGEGDSRERAKGHALDRLVLRPRPRTRAFGWKSLAWWDLFVHGKCLIVKWRGNGPGSEPTELWNVPWPLVQEVKDNSGVIGYNVVLNGTRYWVRPDDAIVQSLPGGFSPLEPLRRSLALEDAALTWQGQSFMNGVTPRGAFVSKDKLDEKTLPRLRAELEKLYAGPDNAGRFGLFDQGLEWAQMGHSAVDAELIAQRKLTREEVCSALDVAPPLIGLLDRATFNNIDTIKELLYVETLGSRLAMFEDGMQGQLVDDEPAWDGLWLEHNLNDVLKPNPEARFRAYLMSQQSSTTTIDERRKAENLPALNIPGVTDVVLVPANMIPAGAEKPADAPATPAKALVDDLTLAAFTGSGDSGGTVEPVTEGDAP